METVLEEGIDAAKLYAYDCLTAKSSGPAQAEIPLKSMNKANISGPILFPDRKGLLITARLMRVWLYFPLS